MIDGQLARRMTASIRNGTAADTSEDSSSPNPNRTAPTLTPITVGDAPNTARAKSTSSPASTRWDADGRDRSTRGDRVDPHGARCAIVDTGVDEHHKVRRADVLGQLWRQLWAADDLRAGEAWILAEGLGDVRAHGVIAAQHVAVPDDEHATGVHLVSSSSISPPGPISCNRSCISPSACVEQLRHGS